MAAVCQRRLSMDSPEIRSTNQSRRNSQQPVAANGSPHIDIDDQSSVSNTSNTIFKTTKRRWAFLFAISVFGLTSGLVDTKSPILHTMLDLLELPLDKYVYIGLIFTYLPILTTFPTALFIDKYGLKSALYIATFFMIIRNTSQALLFNPTLPYWQHFKMIYWIVTMVSGMQVIVTFYCLPLKISETWFAVNERSIAWTVIISSSSVGDSLASFTFPRIIHHVKDVTPLFWLNIFCAIFTTVTVLVCITKSKPKYPPSERTYKSSKKDAVPFYVTLKRILIHRDMMIHILHEAFFDGAYIAVMSIQQDILLASGHTEIFVGNLMSITSVISLVMLIGLSSFVHKIERTVLVCKLGSASRSILFVLYSASLLYPVDEWIVLLAAISYSICRSWVMPNYNNMTAHLASGNVSEATVSSFQVTLTIATMTLNQVAFMSLVKHNHDKPDYTHSMIFSATGALTCATIYLLFFRGKVAGHVQNSEEEEANRATIIPDAIS